MKRKSYKYVALLGTVAFLFQAKGVFSQTHFNCGTTKVTNEFRAAHPELLEKEANYEKQLQEAIQAARQQKSSLSTESVLTLPIVFHIIHQNGTENISDAQILDQVAILNRDYAKLNADTANIIGNSPFDTLAAKTNIRFRLARIDPNGNCTNGIDRIYSHLTNSADDAAKLNPWPREKYINVWVVKTIGDDGVAGYAFYPSAADGMPNRDGILILHNYIGSIGTSNTNSSRALTHEIGHYLNLPHVWGDTNNPGVACGDDGVEDTPVTKGRTTCSYAPTCDATNFSTVYNFSGVTPTSGATDTTTLTPSFGMNFGAASAVGVSANSVDSLRFSFSGWDVGAPDSATVYDSLTGSINTTKYYEITVTPAYGSIMTLTGVSFTFQRDSAGVRTYSVRSSVNNYATNLAASVTGGNTNLQIKGTNEFFIKKDTTSSQTGSKITLSGTGYTNVITPITFRIYGWNAEDSTGTFSIDNLSFTGSAGTIENTQNYMEYSYCSVMFTKGQKERMRIALEQPMAARNHLWSAANLVATGTDDASQGASPCVPKPEFYSTRTTGSALCTEICEGGSLKFNKYTLQGSATSFHWEFEGGSPATSTAAAPTVTYNTAGSYAVKLTATNASGTDSIVKVNYIRVSPGIALYNGLALEHFDNTPLNYWSWTAGYNYDNNNPGFWTHTTTAGYSGNSSMLMNAYGNYANDVDDLISPPFDLRYITGASLTFRCAGASKALNASEATDVLKVYSSTNCGETWILRTTINGSTLLNNGYVSNYFMPTSASQWALHSVNIPSSLAVANVRFKFEYTSGGSSNNIYIDDININGVLGVNDMNANVINVSVYPNPANQTATISYHLNKNANVKVELVDVLGKKLFDITNNNQGEGDYSIELSKQQHHINSGIYFVKVSVDNVTTTKRLIFTE